MDGVVIATAVWGGVALTLHLRAPSPLQLPFSKSPCSHGNRFSKYLSPPGAGRGRGPQHHLRGGPAIRVSSPPQAVSLPHPPPRAPPRLSGDHRTRVSAASAVRSQPPPSGVPGVQVPALTLTLQPLLSNAPGRIKDLRSVQRGCQGPPTFARPRFAASHPHPGV